jgi:hypothetical protein
MIVMGLMPRPAGPPIYQILTKGNDIPTGFSSCA